MDTQIVKELIREFRAADLSKLSIKQNGFEIDMERQDRQLIDHKSQEMRLQDQSKYDNRPYDNGIYENNTVENKMQEGISPQVYSATGANSNELVTQAGGNQSLDAGANSVNYTTNSLGQGGANTSNAPKKYITSPMVGTFYASGTPNGAPYATVGSKVKKGDCVCIIEARKLMNEIEADADGEIVEILLENEAMVEFGQPLFVIQ